MSFHRLILNGLALPSFEYFAKKKKSEKEREREKKKEKRYKEENQKFKSRLSDCHFTARVCHLLRDLVTKTFFGKLSTSKI